MFGFHWLICLFSWNVFQWSPSCQDRTQTVMSTHLRGSSSSTFWKESTSKESFLHTQNQVTLSTSHCLHLVVVFDYLNFFFLILQAVLSIVMLLKWNTKVSIHHISQAQNTADNKSTVQLTGLDIQYWIGSDLWHNTGCCCCLQVMPAMTRSLSTPTWWATPTGQVGCATSRGLLTVTEFCMAPLLQNTSARPRS